MGEFLDIDPRQLVATAALLLALVLLRQLPSAARWTLFLFVISTGALIALLGAAGHAMTNLFY